LPYEKWDSAVTADIQCRFSSGQTPTWEEFWYWIEMIQKGIENHEHSGLGEGDGPLLHLSDLAGYATIEALEEAVAEIYVELNSVIDDLDDVISTVSNQGDEISSLGSIVSSILSDLYSFDQEISDLWDAMDYVVGLALENSASIATINLSLSSLSQSLASIQQSVSNLANRVDDVEDDVVTAQDRADDAWNYADSVAYETTEIWSEISDIWNSIQWIENNCCG